MKFSESWLRSLVEIPLSTTELAHVMTMAGVEVEAVEPVAPEFEQVVVSAIVSVARHPAADRLTVCSVDVGGPDPLTIVCGAPNALAGLKVPCALVGASLAGVRVAAAKMRGVESNGMLCSERDLGLSEESSGLMVLPSDAIIGSDIRSYLDLDDRVFTLKLTPNRSDCLSLAGVAREVAALAGSLLSFPQLAPIQVDTDARRDVTLIDREGCPRYCGRVIHLHAPSASTPEWMKRRLERSGLRPISVVVDVTNYVMLELGQPLHAFDQHKLKGVISVRRARDGEQLTLLNHQTVRLQSDMLVIADEGEAVALAGVMGGQATAVSDQTSAIFLESAFFAPSSIQGRPRRLGIDSDAAYRFERGVDFAGCRDALERASQLILDICGGKAGPVSEARADLPRREVVEVRTARACRLLGFELTSKAIADIFDRLHFSYSEHAGVFRVLPPSYRFDLLIEEDMIEEIARLYGYDRIPTAPPRAPLAMLPEREAERTRSALCMALIHRDYQQIITYSFVDPQWEIELAGNDQPITLRNPMSSQASVMRSTLMGGLVDSLRFNLNRQQTRVRLFEVGRCFRKCGEDYHQPERIAGLAYGATYAEQWGAPPRQIDYYDVKGDLEALCVASMRFTGARHPGLHPGRSARIEINGEPAGWLGELHPKLLQKYDLSSAPVLFELELAPLLAGSVPVFAETSKFPAVRRDIAVIVPDAARAQSLIDAMSAARPACVKEIALFDVYRGAGIADSKKSLAFRVVMQDTEKTLTEEEISEAVARLTNVLTANFDAHLRK